MRLLADQCISQFMVNALQEAGHEVLSIRNICPGCPDRKVAALARQHDCILLTEDSDFGELVVRQQMNVPGVVLVRLAGLTSRQRSGILLQALAKLPEQKCRGRFVVVEAARIRIRPLENA